MLLPRTHEAGFDLAELARSQLSFRSKSKTLAAGRGINAHMKTRQRKQARSFTPPLVLRDDHNSTVILLVDHTFITDAIMRTPRTTAFLQLHPGLSITVGSRSINKRRVTVLSIKPTPNCPDESAPTGSAFSLIRRDQAD